LNLVHPWRGGCAGMRADDWYSLAGMADDDTLPEYRTGSDSRTLRDALGCFATGVTVVTCFDSDGSPMGITANSFTSVSLDPPLLLVCIHKHSACASALLASEHFAVNVLQTLQQPASIRFSTRQEDRFGANDWSRGEFGAPVLQESLSVFECERNAVHEGGDHHILIGRVVKASFNPELDPLLYFRGKYRRLHFD
ncbi:MAG: flavin reductase family protein, partial [Pseudomonadota bacterium]